MAKDFYTWTFSVLDIQKITGISLNAIHQHIVRGRLDPHSLESLVVFMSRAGTPALKRKILRHALYEDADTVANRAKRKKKEPGE